MKKNILLAVLIILINSANTYAAGAYSGGSGEPNTPYLIATPADLNEIGTHSEDWNDCFLLTADINMAEYTYTKALIAPDKYNSVHHYAFEGIVFTGTFDGNDHKIINFTIDTAGVFNCYLGLFGKTGQNSVIKNLVIKDCNIIGGNESLYFGGLVADNESNISNCQVSGNLATGNWSDRLGGLVGTNRNKNLNNCSSNTSITGGSHCTSLGGLIGENRGGRITNCYTAGSITSGDWPSCLGGLIGVNNGYISNCKSSANITTGGYCCWGAGGLIGTTNNSNIENCSANSVITCGESSERVGGLVGFNAYPSTIINCSAASSVNCGNHSRKFGGLVGHNSNSIINCRTNGRVSGGEMTNSLGGFVGWNEHSGAISNCQSGGDITAEYASCYIGGLVGWNDNGIVNCCYADANVINLNYSGDVGGIVGVNFGYIKNCWADGTIISGNESFGLGGLVGYNGFYINNCYASASITGGDYCLGIGGLVSYNDYIINNCYSSSIVNAGDYSKFIGSLVGSNSDLHDIDERIINNTYSTGPVTCGISCSKVGGLVGYKGYAIVNESFWDLETTGMSTSDGGTGKTTEQMQTKTTFTDAAWDFIDEIINGTEDIWKIDVNDYPRLWWQLSHPLLLEEPQFTLGTTNTIYWEPVLDANDYYAECANDPNFYNIIANSGWITDTSHEFNDLQLNQQYFYRVKARIFIFESGSSNIESSTQTTLFNAVDTLLDANSFKDPNQKDSLLEKLTAVEAMIEQGRYQPALKKLHNDILKKTDGCENEGSPDKNDWLITCDAQSQIYPLIMETIDYVMSQMGPYDLISFSSFAEYWLNTNCSTSNDCGGTDLDFSGSLDAADLKIFCNYWLIGTD